jgi:hypothetical protein
LGIRFECEALARVIDPGAGPLKLPGLVYGTLALLTGGLALAGLWTRGTGSTGTSAEVGLVSAFLAWTSVWLAPRRRPRLYALLIVAATLLLLWVALSLV